MSSKKCNSYVCRMISRKIRRGMQVTSLPVVEPKRGKAGELPELRTMGIGWPGLVGPDIIVYNQNHQAKTGEPPPPAPSIMLTPPRGAPWHLSGITEGGLAVNKLKYSAATDTSDGEPTKHIHEHHHYDCTYKPDDTDLPKVIRNGVVRIKPLDEVPPSALRQNVNRFPNNIFMPRNNRRSFENGPFQIPQYTPFYNCPYFGNPNAPYGQSQFPYANGPAGGQHHHFHQHFYHSQYQYQYPTLNYHHPPHYRFLPQQQASMQFNQHSHHHFRQHFEQGDSQAWPTRSEFNGRRIIKIL